jgi:hypothetical protein
MLLDASVARSIAVLGWVDHLAKVLGGSLHTAHGVLAARTEPSELQGIRDALQRARLVSPEADQREWRRGLGLRARWLDAGEAVSIAIAHERGP